MRRFIQKACCVLRSGIFWTAVGLSGVLIVFLLGFSGASSVIGEQQLLQTEQNIRRSVAQFYALNGRYPEDFSELADSFGLQTDSDLYVVHYENLGSNLLPDIRVFAVQ